MSPFQQIVEKIKNASSLLILTHARSDGDGLGSMAAIGAAARAAGKKAASLVPDAVPERYAFLFGENMPASGGQFAAMSDAADLIVIVDTCSFSQLDNLGEELRKRREKIIAVDHHATFDDIGTVQWNDTTAAAAGVMTTEIIQALGWPITCENQSGGVASIAEALAMAITSDTGWLRFSNTDSRCLRALGVLLDAGVKPDKLYARLFQCDRPARLRLTARMLQSLELYFDDRLAVMSIRREDFAASGAKPEETENLINEALRIGSVEVAILLVENDGIIRASLRSRDFVDVAAVAKTFGGGGHARASGLRCAEPLDTLKARLIEAVRKEL